MKLKQITETADDSFKQGAEFFSKLEAITTDSNGLYLFILESCSSTKLVINDKKFWEKFYSFWPYLEPDELNNLHAQAAIATKEYLKANNISIGEGVLGTIGKAAGIVLRGAIRAATAFSKIILGLSEQIINDKLQRARYERARYERPHNNRRGAAETQAAQTAQTSQDLDLEQIRLIVGINSTAITTFMDGAIKISEKRVKKTKQEKQKQKAQSNQRSQKSDMWRAQREKKNQGQGAHWDGNKIVEPGDDDYPYDEIPY